MSPDSMNLPAFCFLLWKVPSDGDIKKTFESKAGESFKASQLNSKKKFGAASSGNGNGGYSNAKVFIDFILFL